MKANLTLVNSNWTGGAACSESLGIDARTLYPPVVDPAPGRPWDAAAARLSRDRPHLAGKGIRARDADPGAGRDSTCPTLTLTIVGTWDRHVRRLFRPSCARCAASLGSWIEFRQDLSRDEVARADGDASLRHSRHARRALRHGAGRNGARRHDRVGAARRRADGDRRRRAGAASTTPTTTPSRRSPTCCRRTEPSRHGCAISPSGRSATSAPSASSRKSANRRGRSKTLGRHAGHRSKRRIAQQLVVGASRGDAPVLQEDQPIAVLHRRQPVRDRRSASACRAASAMAARHLALGLVVERGRRLVEDQHRGIVVQRARDRDALPLPARQPRRRSRRALVSSRCGSCATTSSSCASVHGAGEPLLVDRACRACRTRCCGAACRRADRDPAARSRSGAARRARGPRDARRRAARGRSSAQQSEQHVDQRALAGAGRPDDADRFARREREVDVDRGRRAAFAS